MWHPVNSAYLRSVLLYFSLALTALYPLPLPVLAQSSSGNVAAASAADPDKPASEMNHHIAGVFLIAIGVSVICGKRTSLAWLRWLPPVLFIAAGLFLAAWSDDEIWPRGSLSWVWLLHHDAEARQHKLYAFLLLAVGIVEYLQAGGRLRRPWLRLVFPALCILGGVALFFHQHESVMVANANAVRPPAGAASLLHQDGGNCRNAALPNPPHPTHHHHEAAEAFGPCASALAAGPANDSAHTQEHTHGHAMTASAANIQREHAWFAIVGFCVALFKILHDFTRPPARVTHSLWANSMIFLGILLLLYTE